MRQVFKNSLPQYLDGTLEIYEVVPVNINGFFSDVLKKTNQIIYFEIISIFDKTKFEARSRGIEITKKLRIPPTNFDDRKFVKIDNKIYTIENATPIIDNRDGFSKTELTLSNYNEKYEIEAS